MRKETMNTTDHTAPFYININNVMYARLRYCCISNRSRDAINSGICPICLSGLFVCGPSKPRRYLKRLQCGHVFHPKCINRWLRKCIQCPMCRAEAYAPYYFFTIPPVV
jgi:hypothetical protein